jgi:hypothetical protein
MKLHVLTGDLANTYRIVVHQATPATSNVPGFTLTELLVATGRNTSVLTVGTGPGQTTQLEMDGILAGTIMEGVFAFTDIPGMTNAQRNAALDAEATQTISTMIARLNSELKYYGATRN